jgi:hypothetical protein
VSESNYAQKHALLCLRLAAECNCKEQRGLRLSATGQMRSAPQRRSQSKRSGSAWASSGVISIAG